jgi:hypothetical protein
MNDTVNLASRWTDDQHGSSHYAWTLRRGTSTLTCRIRDDSPRGFDVQTFDDATLIYSQRCSRESGAQAVAASLKRDHLRTGWAEAGSVRREHV